MNVERERKKEGRKEKKRKGKKKRKGRKNTTFLRRRGFSSRRVNDQPVVETNNDIMVIQGSTFSSSRRIPSLSVPSLDPLLPLQGNKVAPVFKTKPPFLPWKIRERDVRSSLDVLKTSIILGTDVSRSRLWISNSRDDLTSRRVTRETFEKFFEQKFHKRINRSLI